MRKLWMMILLLFVLSGCSRTENFETVMDPNVAYVNNEKMVIMVDIPDDASLQVMESSDDCVVYICDDYSLTYYIVPGGDIQKTIMDATGYTPDQLDIISTEQNGQKRYVFVWAAAGETGEEVGRCCIIDDGSYHYVLTAMADAEKAGTLANQQWKSVFRSFRLISADEVVSSGS